MWKLFLELISFWISFTVTPKRIVRFLEAHAKTDRNNLEFISREMMKASCVQLTPRRYRNLPDYLTDMLSYTAAAVDSGAQLLVFPAYTGLFAGTMLPCFAQLLSWVTGGGRLSDLGKIELHVLPKRAQLLIETFHPFIYEVYMHTFSTLARLQHIYIVAGTSLFYERGQLYNRCVVFGPDGVSIGEQDKTAILGLDLEMGIHAGKSISLIPTPFGKLAVIIGTDGYYFENFQIAKDMGAEMFAAPCFAEESLAELLRCRAHEYGACLLYSALAGQALQNCAAIFEPLPIGRPGDGTVCRAENSDGGVIVSRLNILKRSISFLENDPNRSFLNRDFLHSYRYNRLVSGALAGIHSGVTGEWYTEAAGEPEESGNTK